MMSVGGVTCVEGGVGALRGAGVLCLEIVLKVITLWRCVVFLRCDVGVV